MSPTDQERLRQILASFDEAGLVALANVGLLRRARKDLDSGPIHHEETDTAIVVSGPDWSVTMPPEGPTKATDNTKATGITRQILTATLYLQAQWALGSAPEQTAQTPVEAAPPAGELLAEALLQLTPDDLQTWAGKTAFKQVLALCDPPPAVTVELGTALAIRLIQHGIEARLFPGSPTKPQPLLDSFRTTGPKAQQVRWVVMAVVGFWASRGRATKRTEATHSIAPSGTATSRQQVLESARELFQAMLTNGLAHLSERTSQRLFTLSVSATAVLFPRLARLVRAIADDVDLQLQRHANADNSRLFERLCGADAMCRALQNAGDTPPLTLAGRPRTEYEPAADLVLIGVGAFPWQTASGFEGVTGLFWEPEQKRFLTWTASRPVSTPGRFSAGMAYTSESLWNCASPKSLCRSRFLLAQPKINPAGRLSGSKESRAEILGRTLPAELDFGPRGFADWLRLARYLGQTMPLGLAEPQPLDRVVVLKPTAWGERVFVELTQTLQWTIHDEQGRELVLSVPWNGVNETIVEFLEQLKPDRDQLMQVVARVALDGSRIVVEPLSFLSPGTPSGATVLCPGFDRELIVSKQASLLEKLRAKYGRDRIPTTIADEEGEPLEERAGDPESSGVIPRKLHELEQLLAQVAEGGTQRLGLYADRFQERLQDLRHCGLTEFPTSVPDSASVLATGYLTSLHRQAVRAALLGFVSPGD